MSAENDLWGAAAQLWAVMVSLATIVAGIHDELAELLPTRRGIH